MGGFRCLEKFPHGEGCHFCLTNTNNEIMLGPIYQMANLTLHYYCLLMASHIEQNGSDKQGLLGFFLKDIKKELDRGSKSVCDYCKCYGATIHCCGKKCKKVFHLPCGQERGSLHQFYNEFKSFCSKHKPTQRIPSSIRKKGTQMTCVLCAGNLSPSDLGEIIWPPCCKPSSLFHKECIQKMACSAGFYHFRCPLCNNSQQFQEAMLHLGIYVPEREAAWEREPNAYADLNRFGSCDAVKCDCPQGRNYHKEHSQWKISLCNVCGGSAVHLQCSGLWKKNSKVFKVNWKCSICTSISENSKKPQLEEDKFHRNRSENDNSTGSNMTVGPTLNLSTFDPSMLKITDVRGAEIVDCITISDSEEEIVDIEEMNDHNDREADMTSQVFSLTPNRIQRKMRSKRRRSGRSPPNKRRRYSVLLLPEKCLLYITNIISAFLIGFSYLFPPSHSSQDTSN